MSSTSPGETKNIVDALRRALQGPASQLAGGASSAFGSFSISLQPSTEQTPGGTAQTFQSTIDVSALNGFIGSVTLTETDTLTGPGFGSVGIPTSLVQVGPSSPTNDGLVPLNVNVTANCPSGQYLVTVTGTATNNGQTQIAQAVLTVTVGSGIQKCNSDSDCGAGGNCDNGQCISPIDNLIIGCGTSPCGSGGIGTNPCNTSRCRNLCSGEQAGLAPVWLAGCCYCTSKTYCSQNCPQYTAQCQAQWGPCSQAFCDAQNICVCTHCKSTTPISVTCPSNMVACMDATTPTATIASGLFALTNTNPSNTYGITMSVVPTGPNCSCCGGGPVLSTSGFYLTPTGSQQVMVSVPVTCAKKQCYNWNLKISITTGAVGQHGFISTGDRKSVV